jgi:type I restriction enzyme R subunit
MAVVVSAEAARRKSLPPKLAIKPHRERMNRLDAHGHDIEFNFKDPDHPLQLVFVCAMWLTGFDAPTVSHAVHGQADAGPHADADHRPRQPGDSAQIHGVNKRNGEIVDYYNVFRA